MKTARAWLTWCGAVLVLTAVTASCGSDELVGPPDDGNVVEGGAGGEGGSGSGGTSGTGGTPQRATDLGKACSDQAQCGGELVCSQSPSLPQGLCTQECDTTADCTPHGPGVCDRLNRLCFESCTPGQLGLGEKCHGRDDMACSFVDAEQTMNTCSEISPCPSGEVCAQGVCFRVFMGCQPNCDSDSDCPGAFCDLGSGFCVDEEPEGLPIGAPCDPELEEDPCAGLCLGSDPETAFCSGLCRISRTDLGCGEEPDAARPDAACLLPSFVAPNASLGDSAFCAQLCDCNADCGNENLDCLAFVDPDTGEQQVLVDRFGFCGTAGPGDLVLEECPPEGGAGAGGGGGEAGSAGAGGSSGAAAGSGGSAGSD